MTQCELFSGCTLVLHRSNRACRRIVVSLHPRYRRVWRRLAFVHRHEFVLQRATTQWQHRTPRHRDVDMGGVSTPAYEAVQFFADRLPLRELVAVVRSIAGRATPSVPGATTFDTVSARPFAVRLRHAG